MDEKLANGLVFVINIIKEVYEMSYDKDEQVLRPLMQQAMHIATELKIPFESEDGIMIENWGALSSAHLERTNKIIDEKYKLGDAE